MWAAPHAIPECEAPGTLQNEDELIRSAAVAELGIVASEMTMHRVRLGSRCNRHERRRVSAGIRRIVIEDQRKPRRDNTAPGPRPM